MTDNNQISAGVEYGNLYKTALISFITAFFSYVLIYFLTNYVVLYFAYDFDIPAYFDISGVQFINTDGTKDWSRDALITILLSRPISAVLLGIFLLIILMMGSKKPIAIILLLFWANIFSFKEAFGILIDDAIAGSGTYEVAIAMNIGTTTLITASVILIFILYKIGMMNGRLIVMSFQNQNLTIFQNRIIFFIVVFLLPWILILAITFKATTTMVHVNQFYMNIPIVFLLLPFLTAGKIKNRDFAYSQCDKHQYIDLILTLILVVLAFVMIFVMFNGIQITNSQ